MFSQSNSIKLFNTFSLLHIRFFPIFIYFVVYRLVFNQTLSINDEQQHVLFSSISLCYGRIGVWRWRTGLGTGFTLGTALFGGIFLCYVLVLFWASYFSDLLWCIFCVFLCVYFVDLPLRKSTCCCFFRQGGGREG